MLLFCVSKLELSIGRRILHHLTTTTVSPNIALQLVQRPLLPRIVAVNVEGGGAYTTGTLLRGFAH
jgi:hypothetical protein